MNFNGFISIWGLGAFQAVSVLPELFFGFVILIFFCFTLIISYKPRLYPILLSGHLKALLWLLLFVTVVVFFLYYFVYGCIFSVVDPGLLDLFECFESFYLNNVYHLCFWSWVFVLKMILSLSFFFYLLIIIPTLERDFFFKLELFFFLALSFLSFLLLCETTSFMSLYLALEMGSFCFYILSSFKTFNNFSVEAGLKYFILGAFSSAFFLFGLSLLYGLGAPLDFFGLRNYMIFLATASFINFGQLFPLLVILISFLFKVGAAPFHLWVPDVYDGSPTFVTFYFSTLSKTIFLSLIARFYWELLIPLKVFEDFGYNKIFLNFLFFCASLSIILGSIAAIFQDRLKRWLAYSGIVHVGFSLLAVPLISRSVSYNFFFFYLISYLSLVFSFFLIIYQTRIVLSNKKLSKISELASLFSKNSNFASLFSFILFSFAGIPPFIGFFAKIPIVYTLILNQFLVFGFFILVCSVISAFYYIRLISILFFDPVPLKNFFFLSSFSFSILLAFFLYLNLFGYLYFFIFWV